MVPLKEIKLKAVSMRMKEKKLLFSQQILIVHASKEMPQIIDAI